MKGTQNLRAVALLAMMIAGCKSTPQPQVRVVNVEPSIPGGPAEVDAAVASDPCVAQLHNMAGALLMYYGLNKQLPPKLDDVKSFADVDTSFDLACPLSHLPYLYFPKGLIGPGQYKRIIVADPAPSHHGKRYCIVMAMQSSAAAAQSLEVLEITEKDYGTYVPVGN